METRFVHRISCTRILARRLRPIPLRVGVSPVIALRKRGKRALGNAAVARVPQRGACCSIGHRSHASENLGFGQSRRSGQPPREAQRPSNIVSGAPSPIAPTLIDGSVRISPSRVTWLKNIEFDRCSLLQQSHPCAAKTSSGRYVALRRDRSVAIPSRGDHEERNDGNRLPSTAAVCATRFL